MGILDKVKDKATELKDTVTDSEKLKAASADFAKKSFEASKNKIAEQSEKKAQKKEAKIKQLEAEPPKPKKNPKLIKAGVMCPECYSQDLMVTGYRKNLVSLMGNAKDRAYMTCKSCGHSWKTK